MTVVIDSVGAATTYWMALARCRNMDPGIFFPMDGAGAEQAQRVCARCPVARQCLDYALDNRIRYGIWGGTSERARARMLRAIRRRPAQHRPVPLT